MGQKDFQGWHRKKADIHDFGLRVYFHEREIWWCALGTNIGFEQDGKGENFCRPVLIFKKFNHDIFWAVPLSKRIKIGRYFISFIAHDGVVRNAILSQLRLLDAKRLICKCSYIDELKFQEIQKAVAVLCL